MQKQLLKYVDNLLNEIFNDSVPVETLERFLTNKLQIISNQTIDTLDKKIIDDLQKIKSITNHLISFPGIEIPRKPTPKSMINLPDANKWIENLPKGRLIGNKGLFPQAGIMLLKIMEVNDSNHSNFLENSFERLLLHIEVKRKNGLFPREKTSKQDHWIEKHNISIALSRYSRQKNDLRFLNTSLKLNDWAYRHHKNSIISPGLTHFLLAISEAEHTLREYWES